MKRFAFSPALHNVISAAGAARLVALALVLGTLAGCDTLNDWFSSDHVDYKDTQSAPPLAVPGDLSAAPTSQQYVAPPPNLALGGAPQRAVTAAGNATLGQLTAQDPYGMHIEHDGDRRWLVVDGRTPGDVWPLLEEFWEQNGFTLATDSAPNGIMTTAWAENRAKIPDDIIRRTIGKLIDFVYSSGTRDRFQTLVTRGANGSVDISITHSGMEEVMTGREKDASRWVETPRDPSLEAAFLSKLMQKFGLTEAQSRQLLGDARPASPAAHVDTAASGGAVLVLHEPTDHAWLRVGLALDRTNFTVDNQSRAQGIYYVRYADTMQELNGEGLFGKLFYKPNKHREMKGPEYRVAVRALDNGGTQVAVVDANGQVDTSTAAQHIMSALHTQLN
jgi:outer membrane protein assembly factor BamC